MTRTLLVTGGAGFIGSRIVQRARTSGWHVRVLDARRPDPEVPDAEVMRGDVTDADAAAAAVRGVDLVCHQAAKVGLGIDFSDAPDYTHANVTGTAVLLRAMAAAGVRRLVLASSMVVYGPGCSRDRLGRLPTPPRRAADLDRGRFEPVSERTGEPVLPALTDEDDPLDPQNVYAASKLAQEHLARSWARETGGSAALLRYHNVYGPGMPRDTPYAGVAAIFRSALVAGRPPQITEDGRQRRDFVHVDDVAAANLAAAEWTTAHPGRARAFNVGSGRTRTVGELAAALSRALQGPAPVVVGGWRPGDVRHITAAVTRARDELGWAAAVPFDLGMDQLAQEAVRTAPR